MKAIPLSYIARNLYARKLTTILTAAGMALVVYVFATVLMLAAGLLTRLAALVQLPVLVGAVFVVHLRAGLFSAAPNLEFAVLVLVSLAAFAVVGGGRWSADHALAARARLLSRA